MSLSGSSSMSIPALDFPLFSQLPAELREEIWRLCLPHRVWEMTQPVGEIVFCQPDNMDGPWPCKLQHTTYMNGRPPLISRVCRESRSVAFKTGSILPHHSNDRLPEAYWMSSIDVNVAWQDRARDSAHLNWTSAYEPEYDYFGSPVHCIAWEASRLPGGGSLMAEYLDRYFGFHTWFNPVGPPITTPRSPDKLNDFEALKQLSNWLVVMRVIVVHSDLKTAAGTDLFGLLGDAPVQIVDVSEEAKIEAYLDLAETCERKKLVTIGQDFRRESADSMKQDLRAIIMAEFGSEELAAAMRPAVMFRLCTRMCNHIWHGHVEVDVDMFQAALNVDEDEAAGGDEEDRSEGRGS